MPETNTEIFNTIQHTDSGLCLVCVGSSVLCQSVFIMSETCPHAAQFLTL